MRDLNEIANECIENLKWIGIECPHVESWTVNYRAKRFGQCQKRNGKYYININYRLLDERCPLQSLRETIFHELVHTLPNCMNHGVNFKKYAELISDCFAVEITRCNTYEHKYGEELAKECREQDKAKRQAKMKTYKIRCTRCGQICSYQRCKMPKFYKYPSLYSHNKCGGIFERWE